MRPHDRSLPVSDDPYTLGLLLRACVSYMHFLLSLNSGAVLRQIGKKRKDEQTRTPIASGCSPLYDFLKFGSKRSVRKNVDRWLTCPRAVSKGANVTRHGSREKNEDGPVDNDTGQSVRGCDTIYRECVDTKGTCHRQGRQVN